MAKPLDTDEHFRKFVASLETVMTKYSNEKKDESDKLYSLEHQEQQVTKLVKLEGEFKEYLLKNQEVGDKVYSSFIEMICDEKRNILSARPYFRERQEVFTNQISSLLRTRNHKALSKFNFNYMFMQYAIGVANDEELNRISKEHSKLRQELVEVNLPLVISRARVFWSRTPHSHLSYMDLIEIATEGLMAAIDKFVGPYSPVFRSVILGRIHGNFIEEYSQTPIHFYPVDKRKLYRANKALSKLGNPEDVDFNILADIINKDVDGVHKTTPDEIADLLAATTFISTDASVTLEDSEEIPANVLNGPIAAITESDSQPDIQYENMETHNALVIAMSKLSIFERKILKLKGVAL